MTALKLFHARLISALKGARALGVVVNVPATVHGVNHRFYEGLGMRVLSLPDSQSVTVRQGRFFFVVDSLGVVGDIRDQDKE